MPFALIPTALGVCFFLIWAFIGGMVLRDGRLAAEQEQDASEENPPSRSKSSQRRAA
jgi:hypothetical protein